MSAIQHYQRALPHDVETAGPIKVLQSVTKVNLVQPPSRTAQRLRGSQRERGTTLILVTHDAALAARCDRVLHMHSGRLASS